MVSHERVSNILNMNDFFAFNPFEAKKNNLKINPFEIFFVFKLVSWGKSQAQQMPQNIVTIELLAIELIEHEF